MCGLVGAVALAAVTVVLADCGHASSIDRAAYIKAAEHVFARLPIFRDSRRHRESSTAYRKNDAGPVLGYTTRFNFTLPPQATVAELKMFFTRWLRPRWRLVESLQGPVLELPER